MTKKDQLQAELKEKVKEGIKPSQIKKSKSLESLTTNPHSQQIKELENQIAKLTAEVDTQKQKVKELTAEKNELADQNSELRINNLKQTDYFTKYQTESKLTQQLQLQLAKIEKDLTITQQDLKSAQRIIELRTIKPDVNQEKHSFDY